MTRWGLHLKCRPPVADGLDPFRVTRRSLKWLEARHGDAYLHGEEAPNKNGRGTYATGGSGKRRPVPSQVSQTRCSSTGCVPRVSQAGQLRLAIRPMPPQSGQAVYSVRRTNPTPLQLGQYLIVIPVVYNGPASCETAWREKAGHERAVRCRAAWRRAVDGGLAAAEDAAQQWDRVRDTFIGSDIKR
jgi:hypothetical protein